MNTSNLYGEREEVFSWVGNDPLLPHLWRVLKNKSGNVDVIYHQPLRVADFENRKSLIIANEDAVASGIKKTSNNIQIFGKVLDIKNKYKRYRDICLFRILD